MDPSPYASPQTESRPQVTWVRYVVLAALCLIATIAYIQRNSIGVAESTIRKELGLTMRQSGAVLTAFFISYSLFQLPSGWLGHGLGTRRGLSIFAFVWSGITGLTAVANGFASLWAVRFGMGAVQAGVFPTAAGSIAKWIPQRRRSFASGALGSFMSVGGAFGAILTGYLVIKVGWRWTFGFYAMPGIVWAVWFWFWFRDRPEDHPAVSPSELALIRADETEPSRVDAAPEPTPWGEILTSSTAWWIGGQQFFRAAGYIFFATWFATYLQDAHKVTVARSGLLNSLPLIAVVFGSLSGGVLSDWLLHTTGSRRISRQFLATGSMTACAALIFASYAIPHPTLAVLVISLGSFFASFAGPCAYTVTIDLAGRQVTPVFSFMNFCGNVGAVVFPLAVPFLVESAGWDGVLFVFAGLHLAAAACWMCFDPNRDIVRS